MCYTADMTIGDRLREARIAAGYQSIASAARQFRFHKQNLRDHEAGDRNVSPEQAQTYAKAFKVEAQWLLFGEGKGPEAHSGVADKGRDWGDPDPEKHESPVYYQDWSGELSPIRFRRFLEPVIAELFGDDVVSGLGDDYFTIHAEECAAQLEAWRESDPEASVTSHLALFLQSMLGGLNYAVNGVHQMKPFQSYAFQTARLLLQPPAPARKAK